MNRFSWPAEWQQHAAILLAFPSSKVLWQKELEPAQEEWFNFCQVIVETIHKDIPPLATQSAPYQRGHRIMTPLSKAANESIEVVCETAQQKNWIETRLTAPNLRFHIMPYGDIWLRDTAPIYVLDENKKVHALCFHFNGWGNKYLFQADRQLNFTLAKRQNIQSHAVPLVLEGGSIDGNGNKTLLTTRNCLLNPNRNPHSTIKEIEKLLENYLDIQKVIWLEGCLVNDHTDGHIDTLARFIAEKCVLCMRSFERSNANHEVLESIYRQLKGQCLADGSQLEVVDIPAPFAVYAQDGAILPASYLNFVLTNSAVIVPTYEDAEDKRAVQLIAECFPHKRIASSKAKAILNGGGAFHCMSQHIPKGI